MSRLAGRAGTGQTDSVSEAAARVGRLPRRKLGYSGREVSVPIAEILRFERYAVDDGDFGKARALYAGLDRKADACLACGTCLSHCPQGLTIPDRLAAAHALLG